MEAIQALAGTTEVAGKIMWLTGKRFAFSPAEFALTLGIMIGLRTPEYGEKLMTDMTQALHLYEKLVYKLPFVLPVEVDK